MCDHLDPLKYRLCDGSPRPGEKDARSEVPNRQIQVNVRCSNIRPTNVSVRVRMSFLRYRAVHVSALGSLTWADVSLLASQVLFQACHRTSRGVLPQLQAALRNGGRA